MRCEILRYGKMFETSEEIYPGIAIERGWKPSLVEEFHSATEALDFLHDYLCKPYCGEYHGDIPHITIVEYSLVAVDGDKRTTIATRVFKEVTDEEI